MRMSLQLKKKKSWLSPGPLAGLRCTAIPEIKGLRITLNQGSRVTFPLRTHSRGESHGREQTIRPRTTFLAQQDPDLCASLTRLRWRGFHNFLCYSCLPPQSYSLFNFYHIIAYFTLASSPLHLIRNVSYIWNAWQCAAEHWSYHAVVAVCLLRASWKCLWVECLIFTYMDTPPSSSWIPPSWGFNLSNLITQPSWLGFHGLGYIIISFHRIVYIFWPTVWFLLFCTTVGQRWKDMTSSSCFFSLRECSGSLLSSLNRWFLSTAFAYQCSQGEPFSSVFILSLLFTLWCFACWLVPTLRNNGALFGNLRVCFLNLCSCRPTRVPCDSQWAQCIEVVAALQYTSHWT